MDGPRCVGWGRVAADPTRTRARAWRVNLGEVGNLNLSA